MKGNSGKRRFWMYLLLAACFILSGCGINPNNLDKANVTQSDMPLDGELSKAEEQYKEPTNKPTIMPTAEPLAEAKEVIAASSFSLIGTATVLDESFLSWVDTQYGDDVLLSVAKAIQEASYDETLWISLTKKSLHVLIDEYKGILESETLQKEYGIHLIGDGSLTKESVTFRFAGDINFDENWSTTQFLDKQKGGITSCFSPDLLEIMESADVMMLNNEFTYSTRGTPLKNKDYTFRANPSRVKLLHELGVDVVSLANNHTYDYGEEALLDTLSTLEDAEIPYVGAGRNLEEARKPVYYIINGRKVAIVSASQIERSTLYTKQATETSAGVLRTKDPTLFLEVIEEAKEHSDYVIVYVHWGTEHREYIDPTQRPLAEQFIDAGADAVIGGHTHCLQGFEFYNGKPIIYSLGNYWFNRKTLDTGVVELKINDNGETEMTFLPCIQKGLKTSLVTSEKEKKRIIDYMQKISYNVTIDESGIVSDTKMDKK